VDELEKKLDSLRKEIEELRRKDQSRGNRSGPVFNPGLPAPFNPFNSNIHPGFNIVPAQPGTTPQNPFDNKYYAPTVLLGHLKRTDPLLPKHAGQNNDGK
jgi:hypothetical protein